MYAIEKAEHVGLTGNFLSTLQPYYSKMCHDVSARKGHNVEYKNMILIDNVQKDNEHNPLDLFGMMVAKKYINKFKNKSKFMGMFPFGYCTSGCSIDLDFSQKDEDNEHMGNSLSKVYHFRTPANLYSFCKLDYQISNTRIATVDQKKYLGELAKANISDIGTLEGQKSRTLRLKNEKGFRTINQALGFNDELFRALDANKDLRSEDDKYVRCLLFSIRNFHDFDNYEIDLFAPNSDCLFIYAINKRKNRGVHNEKEAIDMMNLYVKKLIGLLTGTYIKLGIYNVGYCTNCHGEDPISMNRPISADLLNEAKIFASSYEDIFNYVQPLKHNLSKKDCEIAWRKYQYGH